MLKQTMPKAVIKAWKKDSKVNNIHLRSLSDLSSCALNVRAEQPKVRMPFSTKGKSPRNIFT